MRELINDWNHRNGDPDGEIINRVEAVMALHERQRMMTVGCVRCNECGQEWPCATMLALNGEEI